MTALEMLVERAVREARHVTADGVSTPGVTDIVASVVAALTTGGWTVTPPPVRPQPFCDVTINGQPCGRLDPHTETELHYTAPWGA